MDSGDNSAGVAHSALRRLATRGHLPAESLGVTELCRTGQAQRVDDWVILTAAGTSAAQEVLLLDKDSAARRALLECLADFDERDLAVRRACTAWQLRPDGSPNKHDDPAYDRLVREMIEGVHNDAERTLDAMMVGLPVIDEYRHLLRHAVAAFVAGDDRMLASPVLASYHTVWMWLHQELRLRLGLSPSDPGSGA